MEEAGGFLDYLKNLATGGTFSDLVSGAGSIALSENYARQLEKLAAEAAGRSDALGASLASDAQFKPFTVTTGLSTATTDPTGGYNLTLNPEQMFYQDELFRTGAGMLQSATQPTASREQQLFERMQAMSNPAQERERLALEARLFNQGRGGVTTSLFGGTPEQLAMAKAIEEQRSSDVLSSMQQARAEQAQQAQIGSDLFRMGYMPTQQAISSMTPAINIADIAGAGQRAGVQTRGLLGQTGIEALISGGATAAGIRQETLGDILAALGNTRNAAGDVTKTGIIDRGLGGLFDWLGRR